MNDEVEYSAAASFPCPSCENKLRRSWIPLTISIQEVCIYFWAQLLRPTHAWFPLSVWWHIFPRELCIHASLVIFICHTCSPRSSMSFPETRFWSTWWENQQSHSKGFQCQHKSMGFNIWHQEFVSFLTHGLKMNGILRLLYSSIKICSFAYLR